MKKRFVSLMLIPLLFFSSCEKIPSPSAKEVGGISEETEDFYPKDFLFLGKEAVSFEEFRYYYLTYKNMYLKEDSAFFDSGEKEGKLKKDVITVLLHEKGIRSLAKENGISLSDTDLKTVKEEIKAAKKSYGEEAFSENLAASFMTENLYAKKLKDALLSYKIFHFLFDDGGKYAWDENTYYAYFKERFLSLQILLFPYGDKTEDSKESTLKKAEEFQEKYKGGEDFYTLLTAYKEVIFQEDDSYEKGQIEDVLFRAADALKTGEISSPVTGDAGVYLVRRIEDTPALMAKKREALLFGTTDEKGVFHPGAYDSEFISLYQKKAEKIEVTYGKDWEKITTKSVF